MADNFDDKIKAAKLYQDSLDAVNKKIKAQESAVKGLADITGVAFAGFIQQIEKSNTQRREEARLINDSKKAIQEQSKEIGSLIDKTYGISDALKNSVDQSSVFSKTIKELKFDKVYKDLSSIEDVNKKISELSKDQGKLSGEQLKEFNELTKLKEEFHKSEKSAAKLTQENLDDFLDKNTEIVALLGELPINMNDAVEVQKALNDMMSGEKQLVDSIITSESANVKLKEQLVALDDRRIESQTNMNKLVQEQSNQMTNQISISKTLWSMVEKNSGNAIKSIWSGMKQNNQLFKDAQKDFGLMFKGKYDQMAALTSKAAEFSMSTKDTLQMMGELGEELKTTDTQYLASATEHFVAIQKATGVSSKEVTTIAGEMMRAGSSAEDVKSAMEGANKTAKIFGVNTKKVLEGVSKNLDKMRKMGFQGGVESLTKMVAEAERLRLNVDEIFDMGQRARSIEGAMDMAAELQLAGGSFAQVNPMDLLSAARKGPGELQNILKTMGGDIGKFDEKTGEFTFDPVDVDRLQIMADATGVSLDSMQKMIQKNAEDNKKMDFMPDMQMGEVLGPDGKPLDQDLMNSMLLDAVDVNGKALEGGLLDKAGISSLEDLTADQATQLIQKKLDEQATLEEQAKQNQSFDDSITAFKDAVMNLFTVFQPFIDVLTSVVQALNSAPGPIKFLAAALIGFVAIAPKLAMGLNMLKGFTSGEGIVGKLKGAIMGSKDGGQSSIQDSANNASKKGGETSKSDGKSGLSSLAQGLAKMGGKNVLKGIGNTALAGPALALMLPGMPTLGLMIAIGAGGALLEAGFKALSSGIASFGNKKNIWKGIAAIAVAGPALLVFSAALLPLALMIPIGLGGVLIVAAFQALSTGLSILGNNFSSVAKGAIALILVGASLIPFAIAAQIMTGVDWLSVLAGVGVLALVVLGLMGLGALLMGPQILFLLLGVATLIMVGAALLIASVGLLAAGVAFQKLAEVNWEGISGMGSALMSSVPGLIAFSLASMMFLNPLTLLGMFAMIGTLGTLALVMIPLGASLVMAADGMDRFADGLTKLQAAANSLDLEKLEMLKDLSWSMAMAGMLGGGMGDQIQKIAEALAALTKTSGGGGGGGTKKIEINLKLNGRDMQSIIVDDTSIVS